MFYNIFLFLKIAVFFVGLEICIAYLIHRLAYIKNRRVLAQHFPIAFQSCFKLLMDFFDVTPEASGENIKRFLSQVIARKKFNIPEEFSSLPMELVQPVYEKFQKLNKQFPGDRGRVLDIVYKETYSQYQEKYKHEILHSSLKWLLTLIPVVFASGILLPLIFYFYMPMVLVRWPLVLTILGFLAGAVSIYYIVRDYS